jgi:hypothetical protein
MRKTRRRRGRKAEFFVINITTAEEQLAEFHIGKEFTSEQRSNFRTLLCDGFPELLHLADSPHVSGQWDHPIKTASSMKR